MIDKKYFELIGNNGVRNRAISIRLLEFQLLPKSTSNVKAKVMIWMGMSSKGASDHKSKEAVNQETYLKEYIDRRLLPQISFEWK